MVDEIIVDIDNRMKKSLANLQKEFAAIRTGRANAGMFDSVKVDVYGSPMPLNQVATISVPEPRLVVIQPWDKGNLESVEKAILKSELSLNPSSDGNLIRIQIPDLTEERRKEYVKVAKQRGEDCKVAIRNIRRDGNDMIKELEKEKDISEDESKAGQGKVQKSTDKYVEEVQKLTENKEKEILSI
ncbi:MAG: ribosome recycling factor [bacterium]|nr:ribosome recycling factor [bacterium]